MTRITLLLPVAALALTACQPADGRVADAPPAKAEDRAVDVYGAPPATDPAAPPAPDAVPPPVDPDAPRSDPPPPDGPPTDAPPPAPCR